MSKEYTDLTEHNHIMAPMPAQAMLIQQAAEFARRLTTGKYAVVGLLTTPMYTVLLNVLNL